METNKISSSVMMCGEKISPQYCWIPTTTNQGYWKGALGAQSKALKEKGNWKMYLDTIIIST